MATDKQMTLQISTRQIDQYCAEICAGSANTSRKHSALIALEGFIVRHTTTDKYSELFNQVVDTIQRYAEQTRAELLSEYADKLLIALADRDRTGLAMIHQSVSRNGFDQLLDQALPKLPRNQQPGLKQWSDRWLLDAESKARLASGYPDAFNFKDAGVPIDEYRAMTELKRKLTRL
ncbi:hypothetical protein [Sedimenticola thiotaurini]|uniref:Uncharacterized protein n=1 Tax=Sedimenticola thiotaurini TaxID=1543721 RepID=A0A0F7K024_9GAMM|nr:hypothetical protein [Sedimenticola thiotaurini]AKH20253.1 hypothetical protein AAY24_07715 [Sedimenticola thiotaurini]